MKDTTTSNKSGLRKSITIASLAYGAFTVVSIVVPIVWDRLSRRKRQ